MASEVTITPAAGNAPAVTQAGIGADPGYDAIDLRRLMAAPPPAGREGVLDAGAYKVGEVSGGATLAVELAADVGRGAWVRGDTISDQGAYLVPAHSAAIVLDVTAADVTHPRVDVVALQVRDDEHDASGASDARAVILAGTPTSGATMDNRDGAPALPDTALHLADVLVPAGATEITSAQIRDYRKIVAENGAYVGQRMMWPGPAATVPDGWADEAGGTRSRAVYAELFALLGTNYGPGDGSTTFGMPDMRDAFERGGEDASLGDTGGHAELQQHSHTAGSLAVASHNHGPGAMKVQVSPDGWRLVHTNAGISNLNLTSGGSNRSLASQDESGTFAAQTQYGGAIAVAGNTASAAPSVNGSTGAAGSGSGGNLPPYVTFRPIIFTGMAAG